MNNSTCRNECLNYLSMIKSTDNFEMQNELIDKINWTIDSQISKIEYDINNLEYYLKCKNLLRICTILRRRILYDVWIYRCKGTTQKG